MANQPHDLRFFRYATTFSRTARVAVQHVLWHHGAMGHRAAPTSKTLTLSVPEAARLAGLGEHFIRAEARAGRIPSLYVGRHLRIVRQGLIDYIEREAGLAAASTELEDADGGASPG